MATTVQAQRLIDALKGIGLRHGSWRTDGDFTVATETQRIRDRATGRRYSQFGDAHASLQNRAAHQLAWERRFDLADAGVKVTALEFSDGRIHVVCFSAWQGSVTVKRADGTWEQQVRDGQHA